MEVDRRRVQDRIGGSSAKLEGVRKVRSVQRRPQAHQWQSQLSLLHQRRKIHAVEL